MKHPDCELDGRPKRSDVKFYTGNANQRFEAGDKKYRPAEISTDDKPNFQIENSRNICVLTGAATDTRVIVESFLQGNHRMRSRYKCVLLHSCVRENKLTQDTYYIVKNIIQSIVRSVPAIRNFLQL